MEKDILLKRLEAELDESFENFESGNVINFEDFNWRVSHVAESRVEYRVHDED